MYNVSELENAETYMIQGTEPELHLTNTLAGQFEVMYNEAAPEFVFDQGMYYPATANFGYYCTGFESPGEWDDHHGILGPDGRDIQYVGVQSESFPYVYYTPSYGFAQSPYNPYNPYIPGAMMGVDSQLYAMPTYQNPASAPTYIPVIVQPDIIPNSFSDPLLDTGASIANRSDGGVSTFNHASASAPFPWNPPKHAPTHTKSWTKVAEGVRTSNGPSKKPVPRGNILSGSFTAPASSHVQQNRSASCSVQGIDNISNGKVLSQHNQLKVAIPVSNGLSDLRSSAQGRAAVDKLRPMVQLGRAHNDIHGSQDAVGEQNRGPRTNKLKNQLAVKAYTTKAGDSNSQGNIIINTDQYNKDDFLVDYENAKFFVIKSYSEDDVHKSIKYNVWSSTQHGNKKLNNAFEDALKVAAGKPRGCPIFLFFSVNASGQFCGVAEMTGSVNFHKDMDFWQQDKWSGCFSVKWHIIKDVSNTNFRHIILENNENKPVTNSRDTQEIMYKQGLEMLKIFKHHTSKTSLFDDFMYYENRQKIVLEEKARPPRSLENLFFVPSIEHPPEINGAIQLLPKEYEKTTNHDLNSTIAPATEWVSSNSDVAKDKNAVQVAVDSTLKIGSLSINPKQAEVKPLSDSAASVVIDQSGPFDVVKVGSMPIKINKSPESSGFLTVGTIALDPKALKMEKGGLFAKSDSRN